LLHNDVHVSTKLYIFKKNLFLSTTFEARQKKLQGAIEKE